MAPYIGYDAETSFIPGTLNTSSSLTVQGGGITQTGGDVNFDSGTLFVDESENRVGIGTAAPVSLLQVAGTATVTDIQVGTGTTYRPAIYSPGVDQLAIGTGGTGRLFVNAAGNVGVGAAPRSWSSFSKALQIGPNGGTLTASINTSFPLLQLLSNVYAPAETPSVYKYTTSSTFYESVRYDLQPSLGSHAWYNAPAGRSNATSLVTSGLQYTVTTLSSTTLAEWQALFSALTVLPTVNQVITATASGTIAGGATVDMTVAFREVMRLNNVGTLTVTTTAASQPPFIAKISTTEVTRIDSSGRLLVGTSSAFDTWTAVTNYQFGIEQSANFATMALKTNAASASGAFISLGKSRGTTANSKTVVQSGDGLGAIYFEGADGTSMAPGASIRANVDGTPGAGDMPGRLVFSTTADGTASLTERMRIDSAGTTTLTAAASTAPFIAKISSTEVARIDSSGNLGLGVVPSSQYSTVKVLQFGALGGTVLGGNTSAGGTSFFGQNFYSDPSTADLKYAVSSYAATNYTQYAGEHRWFNAAAGTAGNTITFTQAMTLDASGNVGVGVTPSAWISSWKALEQSGVSLASSSVIGIVGQNWYVNSGGNDIYKTTAAASIYKQTAGVHSWSIAPSGTAGNTITFTQAMTLDASGNLGIGTGGTAPGASLHVAGAIAAAPTGSGLLAGINSNYAQAKLYGSTGGLLDFGASGADAIARIRVDNSDSALQFFTKSGSLFERMRITSAGNVGIGTSLPATALDVVGQINSTTGFASARFGINTNPLNTTSTAQSFARFTSTGGDFYIGTESSTAGGFFTGSTAYAACLYNSAATPLQFFIGGAVRATLNSTGLGIGTPSPAAALDVNGNVLLTNSSYLGFGNADALIQGSSASSANFLMFRTNVQERARIDHAGRFLVGTSTDQGTATLQIQGDSASATNWGKVFLRRGQSVATIGASVGTRLGQFDFGNQDGFIGASILADTDATWSAGDYPSRLVFSTTADGAASPVPQVTITNGGLFYVGTTDGSNPSVSGKGFLKVYGRSDRSSFFAQGYSQAVSYFNRTNDDGTLLEFLQDGTTEGTISVSGTTVSYNGAHLSRWSQLPGGATREEILRGTVLSNIDEMCEWEDEANEQLNRMKVSDVEGDKNVSGVFQCWDDDDDTYTDDFYCAMTGDFIIRIAEGMTVERGDLLMSAGDGTAKPQDDDTIRSKTIAKVTSTNVSCTYEDGSYCVPCVLMAC